MATPLKQPQDAVQITDGEPLEAQDAGAQSDPSWFFPASHERSPEMLAERYRSQVASPMAPGYAELLETRRDFADTAAHSRRELANRPALQRPRRPGRQRPISGYSRLSLTGVYVLAAVAAVAAGGTAGYVAAKHQDIIDGASRLYASAREQAPSVEGVAVAAADPQVTAAPSKKPIQIAKLDVADASGHLNTEIPLSVSAQPAFTGQDLIVKISGLPDTAYLTAGSRRNDKSWLLPLSDLSHANLVVTAAPKPTIDLTIAAVEAKTGELASPAREMTVAIAEPVKIIQASAPPANATLKPADDAKPGEASAIPAPMPQSVTAVTAAAKVTALIDQGHVALAANDVVKARQAYAAAYALGSADGAIGMARSYDPDVIGKTRVAEADAMLALSWYQRADAAGHADAKPALSRLAPAAGAP
ncbi:MAG: hypothetical protein KDK89_21030 [Alphaproteobacteria bacterium]|nr:hypothetical protein [Alphaproteobacteria bacterium]